MSSPILESQPLSQRHLVNLLIILSEANARYRRTAEIIRHTTRRTHHARLYAQKLGLSIDTEKAGQCPQRAISVIPLPVLDTQPSPTSVASITSSNRAVPPKARGSSPLRRRPALKLTVPSSTMLETSRRRLILSPLFPMNISLDRLSSTPPRLVSHFSASPSSAISGHRLLPTVDRHLSGADVQMAATPVFQPRLLPDAPVDISGDEDVWGVDMDCEPQLWLQCLYTQALGLDDARWLIENLVSESESSASSSPSPCTPDNNSPATMRMKRKVECDTEQYQRKRFLRCEPIYYRN